MQIPHADKNIHPLDESHFDISRALGQRHVFEASTNENRWLWVQTQRLGDAQTDRLELLDVVVRGRSVVVAEDFVDVGLDPLEQFRLLHQTKQAPREHSGGGLVTSDEHGHQIIAKLHVRDVGASNVDQKSQQGRILDFAVISVLQLFQIVRAFELLRLLDQSVQRVVDDGHILLKLALSRDDVRREGQVPIGKIKRTAMRRLLQAVVHGADDGRLLCHRPKIVVEYRQADNIQTHRAKTLLHVHHFAARRGFIQIPHELVRAVTEQADHVIEPRLVKSRHELPTAILPHGVRRWNQSLSHDWLQNLRQHPFIERKRLLLQHLSHDDGIAQHHENLGPERQLEHPTVPSKVRVQRQENRSPHQIIDHALAHGRVILALLIAVRLQNLRHPQRDDVAKLELLGLEIIARDRLLLRFLHRPRDDRAIPRVTDRAFARGVAPPRRRATHRARRRRQSR